MKRLALLAMSSMFCGCVATITPPHATLIVERPRVEAAVVVEPPHAEAAVVVEPAPAEVEVVVAPEVTVQEEELVATSEPPELIYEEPDDMPSPGMFWVAGYWGWSGSDWGWVGGSWGRPPEGHIYLDPYYEHVNGHVVFVRGHWGTKGAERPYYGGDRIAFNKPVRPADYKRGEHRPIQRSAGLPPGKRGNYGPKPTGKVKTRPMPTATAPKKPLVEKHPAPKGEAGREHTGGPEKPGEKPGMKPGEKSEPKAGEKPGTKPGEKAEPKPGEKAEPKPGEKPEPKPAPAAPKPAPRAEGPKPAPAKPAPAPRKK